MNEKSTKHIQTLDHLLEVLKAMGAVYPDKKQFAYQRIQQFYYDVIEMKKELKKEVTK